MKRAFGLTLCNQIAFFPWFWSNATAFLIQAPKIYAADRDQRQLYQPFEKIKVLLVYRVLTLLSCVLHSQKTIDLGM